MRERQIFGPDDPTPTELAREQYREEAAKEKAKQSSHAELGGYEDDSLDLDREFPPSRELPRRNVEAEKWNKLLRDEGHGLVQGIGAGGGYVEDEYDVPLARIGDQRDGMSRQVDDQDIRVILERHRPLAEYRPVLVRGRVSAEARVLRHELTERIRVATVDFKASKAQVARLLGVDPRVIGRLLG